MSHKLVSLYIGDGEYYTRTDADNVIAELKSEIERLEILCANYRHDCDNLAISNEQVKRAASTLLKKMNHNKRKRCLAMAMACEREEKRLEAIAPLFETDKECWEYNSDYLNKWHKRWLEIATKFKEAK